MFKIGSILLDVSKIYKKCRIKLIKLYSTETRAINE